MTFRDPGTCAWCLVAMEDGYLACPAHIPHDGPMPGIAMGSGVPERRGQYLVIENGAWLWKELPTR